MKKTYFIADPFCMQHLTGPFHPESPLRYKAIDEALTLADIKTEENTIKPRKVNKNELSLCHTMTYIKTVENNIKDCIKSPYHKGNYTLNTGDVQISPHSLEAALLSAGGALTAADLVMEGTAENVFSYLRPPGHHACKERGMGFCLFNNAALAARYLQKRYKLEKIVIVDWDVHHGNGTQDIFDDDPSVFYLSTHQEGIYPGTGMTDDKGRDKAVGTKLNFPIPSSQNSRIKVLEAFKGPLVEAMKSFKPQFVIISAGFDGHYADPLGGFNLTEEDFAELTQIMKQIAATFAQGKLISLLEGGYNLQALATSALAHVKALRE